MGQENNLSTFALDSSIGAAIFGVFKFGGSLVGSVSNRIISTSSNRTFTSSDPLVADLANDIEALYPNHVVGVNVPVFKPNGQLATDADILLRNSILQVKSGGGKKLTSQLLRTQNVSDLPVIGFGPNIKPSVVKSINQSGGLVTTDRQLLFEVIKP